MVFSFLNVANSYPKWPSSVRARAVIRVRKHHLGIFVSRRESRWSGLRTPQIVSQLLRRAA